jgi:F0F1-type ATP synthase membrane subunit c/vacuolar-type H+-ATPase subunit K
MDAEMINNLAAGATIAIGVALPAFAIGKIGSEAMKAIGRNPEASFRHLPSAKSEAKR